MFQPYVWKDATHRVYIFLFKILLQKYWFESFSCFWSNLLSLAGFFPFKRFIEKELNWSIFKLLVFLFSGCLFLEVPSFSGQFERKAQNLEWGPLDLTLATFAVLTCWTTRTWNAAPPPSKGAMRRVYIFLFKISSQKYWFESFSYLWSNLLSLAGFFLLSVLSKEYWFEVFAIFWSSFLLAAFSLKFLVLAVNLSGKSKA